MSELAGGFRFVHLSAAVYLFGSFAFAFLIARPALHGAGGIGAAAESAVLQRHRRGVLWSSIAVIASALGALWVQAVIVSAPGAGAGSVGNDDAGMSALFPLLTQTRYGGVWLLRFSLALIVLACLRFRRTPGVEFARADRCGFAASAGLLASLALSGHSAAGEGWESVARMSTDALHLLAAGAWLGGLVPLFLLLGQCNRSGDSRTDAVVPEVVWRFSRLGIVCVACLLASGLVNAWMLVGGLPQLVGTPYGRLLLWKLALMLPLLGLAAVNLLYINPGIAAESSSRNGVIQGLSGRLVRNAMIEAGLGLAILLIAANLGITPPARHIQPDWPFSIRWDWGLMDTSPKVRAEVDIGFAWFVLGMFVLQFAFLSRTLRIWTATAGTALLVYGGAAVLMPLTTDAYPTTYWRPAVSYQAGSVANGGGLYGRHCIGCHGTLGYGDGPAGTTLRPPPADLTGPHATGHTAGDLFWWLGNGIRATAMPGFSGSLAEDERWDLINYVRALSDGKTAGKLTPRIDTKIALLAPDFAVATATGEIRTLRDLRGEKLVLLVVLERESAAARIAQLDQAAGILNGAGIEIVVVPVDPSAASNAATQKLPVRLSMVTESIGDIRASIALFARGETRGAADLRAAHAEYLIDKQGYIRARWLPAEGNVWRDPAAILKQAEILLAEPPRANALEDHVH